MDEVDDHKRASKDCQSDAVEDKILCEPKFEIVYRSGLDLGKFWFVANFQSSNDCNIMRIVSCSNTLTVNRSLHV